MPREHTARYKEIASILADEKLIVPAASAGLGALLPRHKAREDNDERPVPVRVRSAIERIGPSAIKVGQLLSTRPDIVPPEWIEQLRGLQDDVPPIDYRLVEEAIEAELGAPPQLVFATFETTPIAAASIGQVHAATLSGGHPVIVKVRRPDIRKQVELDLEIGMRQIRWLDQHGQLPEGLDLVGIAEQFADALRAELDYEQEARNIERIAKEFGDDPNVFIPFVHWEHTTEGVITMDRVEGIPFNRLDLIDEAGLDRRELARRGVDAYLKQIFEHGVYHADPHPGNLFALTDGRIGFTDFGRVAALSGASRDAAIDLLLGFVYRDADLAAESLLEVAREPGRVRIGPLRSDLDRLLGKYHGRELSRIDITEFTMEVMSLVRHHRLGMPGDFGLLMSTMAVLDGVGAELDPEFDFVEQARPFTEEVASEQWSMGGIRKQFARFGRRFSRAATNLPLSADRAMRRLSEGEFRIAVRVSEYEPFVGRIEELVDRLAFAVLIAAFVVGFTLLLATEELAGWIHVLAGIGMIGASIVSIWMFASILLARRRGGGSD
jgi:ubiquinone biosynthesis protein